MKKILTILFAGILFAGCNNESSKDLAGSSVKIEAAADNPCIECTEKIQKELIHCLASAGSDEEKKRLCNKKASDDWVAKCKAICEPATAMVASQETPRMKCLREAHEANLKCLANARTFADSSKCLKALNDALRICPQN